MNRYDVRFIFAAMLEAYLDHVVWIIGSEDFADAFLRIKRCLRKLRLLQTFCLRRLVEA